MCSLPTAVGISTLQYANLNSSRNQFVIGFAIFMSFILPGFITQNPEAISTKSEEFNELASVLLSTNMFVGGFFAVLFDNLLPGTPEERGKGFCFQDSRRKMRITNPHLCHSNISAPHQVQ